MKFSLVALILFSLMACRKSGQLSDGDKDFKLTRIVELGEAFAAPGHPVHLDLNGDGQPDIKSSVLLVGDPVSKTDQFQYYVSTTGDNRLLLHPEDYTLPLAFNEPICQVPVAPFRWQLGGISLMFQKTVSLNMPDQWNGRWLVEGHRFLALNMVINGSPHTAWVELSVNTQTEQLIFHRAGICPSAGANIRAGR